ncbi:hypothetical protein HMPREF1531_01639 [Propionibacterium sp. oral taxon 192 str. F0372]|uniref:FecCD family ABC transporter permease n=1 Tax=Propionibacterium sp. oral taxon 192 TaxID=671222 RepID=UPI0003549139|nr:iron ABC transporter permease [Propionibacterium sp. oral taxon 192]EPH02333.1 hypothetical protein HMPREF1531_01639 [Propionibacterium sp. oral taxon 192 str. F0372]
MNGHGVRKRPSTVLLTGALALMLVAALVVSLVFGSESISLEEVLEVLHGRFTGHPLGSGYDTIIWELRIPRSLLAAIAGAGLSLAGAGMQTLVRNPLADPYLLGLSAGASVGATSVIVIGTFSAFGVWALSVGALIGALGAAVAVYLVAQAQGGLTPLRLVLSGVVMSAAFNAISALMVFLSDDNRAATSVMFWSLGSVAGATWVKLIFPVVVLVVVGILMMVFSGWLDAMAAGPATATALGVPVIATRNGLFVAMGVLVGALVAVSGGIGFVGLIVPHAARMVVGALHRNVLPVSAVGGALFMVLVDIIARVVVAPQEIPLGVVTGVIGAPMFLFLMGRRSYAFGGRDS